MKLEEEQLNQHISELEDLMSRVESFIVDKYNKILGQLHATGSKKNTD